MWKKWQKAEGEGPFSNSLNESDSHKWFCINVENHLAKSCWGNLHGPSHKEGNLYFEWKDLDLHRNQSQTPQSVFSTQSIPYLDLPKTSAWRNPGLQTSRSLQQIQSIKGQCGRSNEDTIRQIQKHFIRQLPLSLQKVTIIGQGSWGELV